MSEAFYSHARLYPSSISFFSLRSTRALLPRALPSGGRSAAWARCQLSLFQVPRSRSGTHVEVGRGCHSSDLSRR